MGSATPPRVAAARIPPAALAALVVGVAILLAGCGGGSSSSSSSAGSTAAASSGAHAVTIQNYMFKPADVTVPVGTTIKFTNEDTTAHTATSKEGGGFESGPIQPGKSAEITLEEVGTFAYYCVFHPFMKGTITVR